MKQILIIITATYLAFLNSNIFARDLRASLFDIAPWGYRDASGNVAGIEYEIINAISKELQEDINVNLVPYKRMIHQLRNGEADFSIFFKSKESVTHSTPLVRWRALDIIVIGLKGKDLNNYEDIRKHTVAVRLGGLFDERFDNDKLIRKYKQKDYAQGVQKVIRGNVDLVIGTAVTLAYEFKKQGINIDHLGKPFFINQKEDWLLQIFY